METWLALRLQGLICVICVPLNIRLDCGVVGQKCVAHHGSRSYRPRSRTENRAEQQFLRKSSPSTVILQKNLKRVQTRRLGSGSWWFGWFGGGGSEVPRKWFGVARARFCRVTANTRPSRRDSAKFRLTVSFFIRFFFFLSVWVSLCVACNL